MRTDRIYLGDGVYGAWDGLHLVITTENGVETTNTIYLTQEVWASLVDYIDALKAKASENGSVAP
jgi:hypothetical protein